MEMSRSIYLEHLIARKHNGLVKVITGIRRCGKSYLLLNLFKRHLLVSGVALENILIYEFDRWQSRHLRELEAFFLILSRNWLKRDAPTYSLTKSRCWLISPRCSIRCFENRISTCTSRVAMQNFCLQMS